MVNKNIDFSASSEFCSRKAYNIRNFDKVVDMKLEQKGIDTPASDYTKLIEKASENKSNDVKEIFERVSKKMLEKNTNISRKLSFEARNALQF